MAPDLHVGKISSSNKNDLESLGTTGPAVMVDADTQTSTELNLRTIDYQHHITLSAHHQHHVFNQNSPCSNRYPVHHIIIHNHIHSEQRAPANGSSADSPNAPEEVPSSSLTHSNLHSVKKEPYHDSLIQYVGLSKEDSSSQKDQSDSSGNGPVTGAIDSADELFHLLDVIHSCTKHNEQENLCVVPSGELTPRTFRESAERANKEDVKQMRKERDLLWDKMADMEVEVLTGRIRATNLSDELEELISVKNHLEEELKMAKAQNLELRSRLQNKRRSSKKAKQAGGDGRK